MSEDYLELKDLAEKERKSFQVLLGKTIEQLIPLSTAFPYDPRDARFIGGPVDYIVFDGLSSGKLQRIVFVEIKVEGSSLNSREKEIMEAVIQRKVEWQTLRVKKSSKNDSQITITVEPPETPELSERTAEEILKTIVEFEPTFQSIAKLIFPKDALKQTIASTLLEEIEKTMPAGLNTNELPRVIISAIKQNPRLRSYGKALEEVYLQLRAKNALWIEIIEAIDKASKDLKRQTNASLNYWKLYLSETLKVIRKLEEIGIVERFEDDTISTYEISEKFAEKIKEIAHFLEAIKGS